VEIEERTNFLRGKLLTERELAGTGELYGRYACRYEVFTPDHLLNQVLRFCNGLLLRQTRVPSNRTIMQENDALLSDVTHRPVSVRDVDLIHLNRLNRDYEPILALCRLLLEHSTLDLRAGRITQLAFVFDMNCLFEKFVAVFLQRHMKDIKVGDNRHLKEVNYQHRLGRLFGEFNMDVDLVLTDEDNRSFLVDTKYKALDSQETHMRLAQADFYQMYAYGNAGRRLYDKVILLYPTTDKVRRTFHHPSLQLHIRQFDPRTICNSERGHLNKEAVVTQLSQVLLDDQYRVDKSQI
jgi:5-methylcytosine-specific restriction enzyme subunit McrC